MPNNSCDVSDLSGGKITGIVIGVVVAVVAAFVAGFRSGSWFQRRALTDRMNEPPDRVMPPPVVEVIEPPLWARNGSKSGL